MPLGLRAPAPRDAIAHYGLILSDIGMTRSHSYCDSLLCRRGFRGTGVGSPNRGCGGDAPRKAHRRSPVIGSTVVKRPGKPLRLLKQLRPAPVRADDRQRGGLAQPADTGIGHDPAQLDQRGGIARAGLAARDAPQNLSLALGANLAGVALAAALVREEVADSRQHLAQVD